MEWTVVSGKKSQPLHKAKNTRPSHKLDINDLYAMSAKDIKDTLISLRASLINERLVISLISTLNHYLIDRE